ncbi:MAG: FecR domain-containing protein [Gemmatimonadetes bacterium]|nr:FecR domain-containing protein [Gemmatimonadota bacterium]
MTDDSARQPDLDAEWEELARFLSGESSPGEQRRLRALLARDPERAALVQALDAALAPPDETPLALEEVERALASVMARRDLADPRSAPAPDVIPLRGRATPPPLAATTARWRRSALLAAAAVIVVAGASLLWRATQTSERTQPVQVAQVDYTTGVGRVDTLRLADGTSVVLGPSSRLHLEPDYGQRARMLTLDGQAFFDVVHDDARPFVVRTASATLRDVGTTFSVESDRDLGTRIVVTSGAVDVAALAARDGEPTVLHGGDRAEVKGDRMTVERGVVSDDATSWTRGALVFHDASMTSVAAELRRWYGIRLVVDDSALAARRVTATFDRASADDVGRVLAAVLGGSATRSGDTLRLGVRSPAR